MNRADHARFMRFVQVSPSGCWEWQGPVINTSGYGKFRPGPGQPERAAHRVAYEHFVGPVPDGLQLDHLCRNRRCVNYVHLEPVTPSVNTVRQDHAERRKTACPICGAEYRLDSDGKRRCPNRRAHPRSSPSS